MGRWRYSHSLFTELKPPILDGFYQRVSFAHCYIKLLYNLSDERLNPNTLYIKYRTPPYKIYDRNYIEQGIAFYGSFNYKVRANDGTIKEDTIEIKDKLELSIKTRVNLSQLHAAKYAIFATTTQKGHTTPTFSLIFPKTMGKLLLQIKSFCDCMDIVCKLPSEHQLNFLASHRDKIANEFSLISISNKLHEENVITFLKEYPDILPDMEDSNIEFINNRLEENYPTELAAFNNYLYELKLDSADNNYRP